MSIETVIPAAEGRALRLEAGSTAKITSPEGAQVVDAWAFGLPDLTEYLSAEHTRSTLEKLIPAEGDTLYSNRRRPILTIVEDTSPGIHDLLLSACDQERYRLLGVAAPHRNCADNLYAALRELKLEVSRIPSPFNIFENVTVTASGGLAIAPPLVGPGNAITLRAEIDLVLVLSSCPMDIALTNGLDRRPKPVHVAIQEN